ncbi:MAG: PD40 domain-containing protein [Deltaproteobacteria bacterium]|nr:PD40 domain-containing protein [Deltaproteobacteria bacterium]
MRHGALILAAVAVLGGGCGGDDYVAFDAAPADLSQYDSARPADGPADGGADTLPDCGLGPARPDGAPFVPTPADIDFAAVHPLPTGEQILFNDWGASPNKLYSMTPDGQTVTEVFVAYRIWSMGVSRARDQIAFSSGYDLDTQNQHYGIPTLGDAIQHTFIYDVASQTAQVVAYGSINDECHMFGPSDTALYVCRRYDFQASCDGWDIQYTNRGWRIGRIDRPGNAFTFLTPDVDLDWALSPQPTPAGDTLFYGRIQISGTTQTRTVMKMALPTGTPQEWKANASFPVLSPDGTRLAYQNWDDQYTLYVANVDGSQPTRIANRKNASEAVFSPDGAQVVFLYDENDGCCIEAVTADGTEANVPRCLRNCGTTNEFITELDWITR